MEKKIISSEKLLSLVAMAIGLGTLLVFMYQTDLIRKHQYMSVYPYLSVQYNNSNNEFSYSIQNKGIGPAIVKSVNIIDSDGKKVS